ncbi:hypothetical protein DOK76_10600, partial [Vagococcus sp. DIV0080]
MDNLWTNLPDFKEVEELPLDIVKEQSDYLGKATNDYLYLDISKHSENEKEFLMDYDFGYKCILRSNIMPEYGFRILEFQYDIDIFPLNYIINNELLQDEKIQSNKIITKVSTEVVDITEFKEFLKETLNSNKIQNLIKNLY